MEWLLLLNDLGDRILGNFDFKKILVCIIKKVYFGLVLF